MGIIFDGITSRDIKLHARIVSLQASPPLRNAFVTVPGKHGVLDFGNSSAERTITVECSVFPQPNFNSLVNIFDKISEWLNPEKGLRQLILQDIPDRFYMARLSDSIDAALLIRNSSRFTLKFICPDPHAYALSDLSYTFKSTGTHSFSCEVGNTYSEPVYYIRGNIPSSDSSYITIKTGLSELRINGSLGSAEILVVDSSKKTARVENLQGATIRNGLSLLHEPRFPILQTYRNVVEISAVGSAVFNELTIQAMRRWR